MHFMKNRFVYYALNVNCCRYIARCVQQAPGSSEPVRVRFAPSPTGQLHLGGLRTALYNYLFARSLGGKFILRIEDTDQTRLVAGTTESLIDMLQWTGITIDEGPQQGGNYGPYIQSQRLSMYMEKAEILVNSGHAYHCFCSPLRLDMLRREAVARGETPRYDNRCRHLTEADVAAKQFSGQPSVIRFKLEPHATAWRDLVYGPITNDIASVEGDPVLIKTDRFPTYHFANVVDDHLMNVTHVLRGVEWQISTTKHVLLYAAFEWRPPQFAHLPLLQNKEGKKLSKRQSDVHVGYYKEAGFFPEAILNLLTNAGSGFNVRHTAGMDLRQLIHHFDLNLLNTNSTRVDFDKLLEFNRLHLKRFLADSKKLNKKLIDNVRRLVTNKYQTGSMQASVALNDLSDEYIQRVLTWSKDRISLLSDLLRPEYEFVWLSPDVTSDLGESSDIALKMLNSTMASLESLSDTDYSQHSVHNALQAVTQTKQWSNSRYMKLLRQALSGPLQGPSVAEMMGVLGKPATMLRLRQALAGNQAKHLSSAENQAMEGPS